MNTSKTCTHCGTRTKPQPQDYDRDTGYGYCDKCLDTFWPIVAKLDFENISFDIRQEKNCDPYLVNSYQNGQHKSCFTCHKELSTILKALRDKYAYQTSSVIP